MNPLWMETVLLSFAGNTRPGKSQHSRSQSVLKDHVKIGPVTGNEVTESAAILVVEVQVPSRQPGNSKSWVRISRGIDQYARLFIPAETDHQNIKAASSQQSTKLRATASTAVNKLRQSQSLHQLVSVNDFLTLIPAKASTKRDSEFVDISRHFTKIPRRTCCHESDRAGRWDPVLTITPRAEHTQNLLTNPEWSIVRFETERL